MKISQAFKLGHRSIASHKRRNLTTIIIVGILFGLLSALIFTVQGTENAIFRAANETYGEEYYVGFETNVFNEKICRREPIPDQPNASNIICPDDTAETSATIVTENHGEIISQSPGYNLIASPDAFPQYISVNLADAPDDAITIIASPSQLTDRLAGGAYRLSSLPLPERAAFVRSLPQYLGTVVSPKGTYAEPVDWYIAGIFPSGEIIHMYSDDKANSPSLNPLDYVIEFLGMNPSGMSSSATLDIDTTANRDRIAYLSEHFSWAENMTSIIAKFDSAASAEAFADRYICTDSGYSCNKPFITGTTFDNRIALRNASALTWGGLRVAEYIIIAIAAIITFFTFIKILSDQSSEICLYRSLGASTSDICFIYAAYLIEICLYAITFMLILGLALSGLVSILNTTNISDTLVVAYGRDFPWPKILIGFNVDLLKLMLSLFAVAALSLLWFVLTKKYQPRKRS